MTNTFRALCAELLADYELNRFRAELAAEARAALAEGAGVTDEELTALVRVFHVAYNAKRTELCALPNRYQHDTESDMADRAGLRAVLARYGTTHPRPIPVAERLPAEVDCIPHPRTSLGRWCWGFERSEVSLARPARWRLMHMETTEFEASHWLPAAAIPLPEA